MILKTERVETVMSSSAIFQSSFERRQVQMIRSSNLLLRSKYLLKEVMHSDETSQESTSRMK